MMLLCAVRLILCLWMCNCASASIIVFNGTTTTIQPALTPNMTLTCTLEDTPSSSGLLIGRDVTSTTENLASVTSLVIIRGDNDIVATITPGHPATALLDLDNIKVTGHMSGQVGERGKIQLTWNYPTHSQAGPYRCEVNGINSIGHNVVFSSDLEVTSATPTILDLVDYIHALQLKDHDHEVKELALVTENKLLGLKLNNMSSTMSQMQNIETGRLECGNSQTWTGHNVSSALIYTNITHTFQTPFDKAPKMQWGATKVYYRDSHANTGLAWVIYYVDIINVTPTGFTLKCSMEEFDHYYIGQLSVNWSAFPNLN